MHSTKETRSSLLRTRTNPLDGRKIHRSPPAQGLDIFDSYAISASALAPAEMTQRTRKAAEVRFEECGSLAQHSGNPSTLFEACGECSEAKRQLTLLSKHLKMRGVAVHALDETQTSGSLPIAQTSRLKRLTRSVQESQQPAAPCAPTRDRIC